MHLERSFNRHQEQKVVTDPLTPTQQIVKKCFLSINIQRIETLNFGCLSLDSFLRNYSSVMCMVLQRNCYRVVTKLPKKHTTCFLLGGPKATREWKDQKWLQSVTHTVPYTLCQKLKKNSKLQMFSMKNNSSFLLTFWANMQVFEILSFEFFFNLWPTVRIGGAAA